MNPEIKRFRDRVEKIYGSNPPFKSGDFGEILCYELHSQPVNPRMMCKNFIDKHYTGLTFKELAQKWGISLSFLGELIADHCRKLEE